MKIHETSICPDLNCNEVFLDIGLGCPRCLSPEGIPLGKIFSKIEELTRITSRKKPTINFLTKEGKRI